MRKTTRMMSDAMRVRSRCARDSTNCGLSRPGPPARVRRPPSRTGPNGGAVRVAKGRNCRAYLEIMQCADGDVLQQVCAGVGIDTRGSEGGRGNEERRERHGERRRWSSSSVEKGEAMSGGGGLLDWIQHFRYRAAGEGLPKGAYLRGSAARPLRDRTQVLAACHSRATLAALCRLFQCTTGAARCPWRLDGTWTRWWEGVLGGAQLSWCCRSSAVDDCAQFALTDIPAFICASRCPSSNHARPKLTTIH